MAPIYNPSAAATDADEQYFTDLGLLSGLSKIVGATGGNTFPTPDDTYGTAATITNNILQWGAASAESWQGYNIGTMTRVLTIVYVYQSTAQYQYLIHNNSTLDDSNSLSGVDVYWGANVEALTPPKTLIYKRVGATVTEMATDATLYSGTTTAPAPSDPAYGWAFYTSYVGSAGLQRMFMKMGSTSNWIPVMETTDTEIQDFQSVAFWTLAKNQRCTTPFAIWGA